jgi:hypothetical protein
VASRFIEPEILLRPRETVTGGHSRLAGVAGAGFASGEGVGSFRSAGAAGAGFASGEGVGSFRSAGAAGCGFAWGCGGAGGPGGGAGFPGLESGTGSVARLRASFLMGSSQPGMARQTAAAASGIRMVGCRNMAIVSFVILPGSSGQPSTRIGALLHGLSAR